MNKVAIVTDSTCDLGNEIVSKYNIHVLPLYVNFEDRSYLDGVEITPPDLFKMVEKIGKLPKTSAATPADYHRLIKNLLDEGYDIVYCGIGANLSGSYQIVRLVIADFPEDRIHLVDSENLSTGIGIVLLKACQLRDQGLSAKEIAEEMRKMTPKVRCSFVVETLDYLHMGGRCSGTARLIGTMLGIRPLIQVIDGKMEAKKIVGPIKRGLEKMVNNYCKDFDAGIVDEDFLFLTYADDRNLEFVKSKIQPFLNVKNFYNTNAGCVIASHCGPGTIGIIYMVK